MRDDDPFDQKPRHSRIDVAEDYDLRAWSDRFGVDIQRVVEAVRSVGDQAAAVERYLNRESGSGSQVGRFLIGAPPRTPESRDDIFRVAVHTGPATSLLDSPRPGHLAGLLYSLQAIRLLRTRPCRRRWSAWA